MHSDFGLSVPQIETASIRRMPNMSSVLEFKTVPVDHVMLISIYVQLWFEILFLIVVTLSSSKKERNSAVTKMCLILTRLKFLSFVI